VALGFRPHTGWSTVVAVGRAGDGIRVVHRSQVKIAPAELPRQVYHAAREMDVTAGAELVAQAVAAVRVLARAGLGAAITQLRASGQHPVAAGLPVAGTEIPAEFTRILASHALLHAAEGDLYCRALADSADRHGLALTLVPARELAPQAARELGIGEAALRDRLAAIGRELGPPWRKDEKDATLAAVLALAAAPGDPARTGT
jgi:hypothetical protein